jgi:3-phosphoshikimate 1-carboxyvinyltransferase
MPTSTTPPESLAIHPVGRFDVKLRLPGSKSLTNRALLLAALAAGRSRLSHLLLADDTRVMLEALAKLGFTLRVEEAAGTVEIQGHGGRIPAAAADLFLGNSGTTTRFLTAAACLGRGTFTLDGVPRMRQRPIAQLVEPLNALGGDIHYSGEPGFPPLRIEARGLTGGSLTLKPTLSSQYISALLQAGPYMFNGLDLYFDGPVTSLPYVLMTVRLMAVFGVRVTVLGDGAGMIVVPDAYAAREYEIEPDASNASYFLAAAALSPGSRCTLEGLGRRSLQGDVGFAQVLGQMGAEVTVRDESITVIGTDRLAGVDVDLNTMPDMAQTLAVAALFAEGPTVIRNIGNLRVKETDRLAALRTELGKLGATVRVEGDDLHVEMDRAGALRPAAVDTYDDHRMAMAFAVAGLRCPGVTIRDPACVNKTFPEFWKYLEKLRQGTG